MVDTETYIDEEQQQPDPQPKPKKLSVKDFAAKIKAKYPDYKDIDDQVLTDKIIAKYPVYKDQVDLTPTVKKKSASVDIGGSSLEAGNALSQSNGEGGGEIPTIEMYNTPSGEMIEANPIALSKKYKELSEAIKPVSDIEMGMSRGMAQPLPDEEKRKEAQKLKQDFPDIDFEGISNELSGLSDETLGRYGKDLMQDREQNPQLYQRKVADLKWREGLHKALYDSNVSEEEYNRINHLADNITTATNSGDYSNQRTAIQSLAKDIRDYGGENKDEILKNFATEVAKVYGNAYNNNGEKFLKDTPESKYLNNDEQLALQYIKDIDPEKAAQYDRLMVDPKDLKDNPDALKGYNHLKQTLEETGIALQKSAVNEELNNIYRSDYGDGVTLTPDQISKAEQLEKRKEEIVQKENELDKKYPDRIENKVSDAVNELLGEQKLSYGEYAIGKTLEAGKNTVQGAWELASNPFMSDASKTLRELAIIGDKEAADKFFSLLDKNKSLQTDQLAYDKDLQTQIDAIKNNKVTSQEQKRKELYDLLKNNTDKFGRVPIKGGKFNINPSSILYGVTDIATTLAPFIGIETATGGIGGAGTMARFLRTANAAFVTSFHDQYAQALLDGKPQSEAYKQALGTTAITAFAMAGAGTPDAIRAMAGTKTSAGKIIQGMSDDAIKAIAEKSVPKGMKAIGEAIKERAKAVPSQFVKGLEGGGKFELAMAGGEALKRKIYGGEVDTEHEFKRAILGVFNFGILGSALGQMNFKSPTELQKGAFLEVGAKPKEYLSVAEQMKKDGELSESEFEQRKEWIKKAEEAYRTAPKSLSEKDKAEYVFQTAVKNDANKGKSDLPPKQAAEAEHTALVADYKREIILDNPTEKQLNDRKGVLERKLEPKKDADGKTIEIPEKELAQHKAELEAVNDAIENKKSVVVEKGNVTGESVPLKTKEDIAQDNGVVVEKPMEVPESIPLKEEKQKNAYTEQYNKALENPELRETALQEISDQWHDPRSRKLIEESIAPEIIKEAKEKYPQEETTLTIDEKTETTKIPNTETKDSITDKGTTEAGKEAGGGKEGKYEAKARKLAEKIMASETPDWLKIDDPNVSKKGTGAEEIKKALADATIKMGKLLDKGVEFSEAVKESVKDLVNMLGEGARTKIEEGFAKDYKDKVVEEVKNKVGEENIATDKNSDKGILNRLFNSKNLPEAAKDGLKEKGLKYKVSSQEEAKAVALSVIEEMGVSEAFALGEAGRFNGGVNGAIMAESINRLAEMETKATTPQEKVNLAMQSAELITRFDEISRSKGQDIAYIDYFYKKSPLGVEMAENAKKKQEFEKWAKPKEQSWKEAFEGFMKDPEFQEIIKGEVGKGMKEERARFRAEKKEKVHKAIDETMDKWIKKLTPKSTGGAATKGGSAESVLKSVGAAMKKAYDAGEAVSEVIKTAIDTISEKLGITDWDKEGFRKDWENRLGKDEGYKESDTRHQKRIEYLEGELKRIRERRRKEPKEKKESTREIPEDEQKLLDEIEAEQTKWDSEKDAARANANEYSKLETERNRQLKRVGEINEKIEILKRGELPETQSKNKKIDTPEIEALKAEKDALEKSVRESISHQKKMAELETELQRLKDRKEKEPKPDSKRVIGAEERLKRDEIEAEKKAWDIENNISKLETELQRVKDRQKKATTPQQRRELTTAEKDLVKQIKVEKEAWRKEVEPERKVREALKAAEKSLAEYERRIAKKDISKEPSSTTPETPELKALREKRDAKRKEYQAMKKEMTKPSDTEIQAERNRKYIEAFSKKLKGLSAREKEEVVLRSHKKLIESGALDYTEFRDIISEVTGRGKMTDAEAAKLKELVAETNKVDVAAERARTERTQEARVLHALAQVKASKASKELGNILYNKPNIGKRLTSLLQLNTLGIASLIRNPAYNIVNQLVVRFPVGIGKTLIDRTIQAGGKAFGKDIQPETDILSLQVQKEFFKKLGLGSKEAVNQFVTGLNRMDYIDKELQGQQIRPLKSMEDLWDFAKGKKHLSKSQVIDKLIQASPQGWTAEIIARALNLGDKPQRFAAEGAQSAAFAKALGLKDIDYDLFIDFPREEAYMQLRKRGVPDAEAAKQADYIRDTIKKEGARSTFQQDNMLNDMLNGIPLSQTGVGGLVKATVVSPYIKIPANAYWSYYNIINPEVAILQSAIYAGKAYAKRNGTVNFAFDKKESTWRHDLNESKYWLAHAATGYGVRAAVAVLVAAGIYRPSNTQDDSKKEREGEQNYEQQGSVNVTKLWAFMKGEDPSKIKEGYTISNNWFGILGTVGDTMAQQEESLTEEQKQNREDYWTEAFDRMAASGLPQFEQGVFGNASSFLNAVNRGGSVAQSWGVNTLGMFTNIVHPAAFAQVSKNQLPYYTKTKADTFKEELKNAMLTRSSWLRKLSGQYPPSKVSIWGEKIEREGSTIQKLFGISKSNDDNFAEPIYKDYKKTNDVDFFPPSVKPEVTVDGERVKLPVKQAYELEELIGRNRKDLIAPFINGMAEYDGYKYTDLKSEESKIAALKIIYSMGYERGLDEFKQRHPEYQNVREEEDAELRKEREALNKEFKESLEAEVPKND